MTKKEWTDILAYYKTMFQLEQLPDANYTTAMYAELKNYDARFIAFAVKQIIATEMTTYNKYPMLSQIYANLPDLSWEKQEIAEKKQELQKLLENPVPERHWSYQYHKNQIRQLTTWFTGTPKEDITLEELTDAEAIKMQQCINDFFKPSVKMIGK